MRRNKVERLDGTREGFGEVEIPPRDRENAGQSAIGATLIIARNLGASILTVRG